MGDQLQDESIGLFYTGHEGQYDFVFMRRVKFTDDNNLSQSDRNSLHSLGSVMTNRTHYEKSVIIQSRLTGGESFNTDQYSQLQLVSFLLADCSAFWSDQEYEMFAIRFFAHFRKENINGVYLYTISKGCLLAITHGILQSFSVVQVHAYNIEEDDDDSYEHYIILILVLMDLFLHRVTKIMYSNTLGFYLTFVGKYRFLFGHNIPRPCYPIIHGLCMGLEMPSTLPFHQVGQYENHGTFGFVHYVSSGTPPNCQLNDCSVVATVNDIPENVNDHFLFMTKFNERIPNGTILQFDYGGYFAAIKPANKKRKKVKRGDQYEWNQDDTDSKKQKQTHEEEEKEEEEEKQKKGKYAGCI